MTPDNLRVLVLGTTINKRGARGPMDLLGLQMRLRIIDISSANSYVGAPMSFHVTIWKGGIAACSECEIQANSRIGGVV